MQTTIGMQPAKRRFLGIFFSLIWCCIGTCVLLGHKTQRRDLFLSAFYAFHRGFWCSIPEIIWRQIHKFWKGVHHRAAEHTKTWGLPFPFLITHILRKKGIKGNATDEPITESLYFGRIQWNQSLSHMPRAAPKPEPEPMDILEMAVE
jgi:hypothetical protein